MGLMKNYVFIAALAVLAGGIFLFLASTQKDPTLAEYETNEEAYAPVYLPEIGDTVSSVQPRLIAFLNFSLGRVPGKDFTILPPETGEGRVNYYFYTRDCGNAGGLNCSEYGGMTTLRCLGLRWICGTSFDELNDELREFEPDTPEEIYAKYFVFESVVGEEMSSEEIYTAVCTRFSEMSSPDEPADICEARFRAFLRHYCSGSSSDYESLAAMEPRDPEDFVCYYQSHRDYKRWVLGIP
jgi:hypothetical protein